MSQGGVMALHYGLSSAAVLGGVVSLSGYLLKSTPMTNLHSIPIFLMHGERDTTIRESDAKNSYSRLFSDK